ncbi:MAG: hypothetical protein ACK5XN_09640 [Bacteroidota bacterium]|jgi:hypothetical protein
MKLTIGMAHFEDYHGAVFTIQSILADPSGSRSHIHEIIVVDSSPGSAQSRELRVFCENVKSGKIPVRFIEYRGEPSTTQPRQAIFDNATGDWVLVVDCHVLLRPNAIRSLAQTVAAAGEQMQDCILSGPMYMDNLQWANTHFDMVWRGQMWGIWATAWKSPDKKIVSVHQSESGNRCEFFEVAGHTEMVPADIRSVLEYAGHEPRLLSMGFVPMLQPWHGNLAVPVEAFEIPAQGLGLFAARRESWPGFNRDFREFGGEEGYIHQKFRMLGRKAYCLPELGWWHRFGRPEGARYRFTMEGKVRNYVLGFQELGMDLDPIRKHFADEGMRPETWQAILADPVGYRPPSGPPASPKGRPANHPQPAHVFDINGVLEFLRVNPRDTNEHFDAITRRARNCQLAIEIGKRREPIFAMIAGGCKVKSYNEEIDAIQDYAERYGKAEVIHWDHSNPRPAEPCDLLFIDTRHNYERLSQELRDWPEHVAKYIIMHDTQANGEVGDDGKDGMFLAIREFLDQNPDWFIVEHWPNQWGLTVLSRVQDERPEKAIRPWPPGYGPGTEMSKMLSSVGVEARPDCSCKFVALQMDIWGVEECRDPTKMEWIVNSVKENSSKWSWSEKLRIAAAAATKAENWALALRLNPLRLEESLVEEALRRAEESQCESECKNGCKGTCGK